MNTLYNQLLDGEIFVSDKEIRSLASLSRKVDAEIYEGANSANQFTMTIKFDDHSDQQILIASNSLERYKALNREFFQKFVKYGGQIDLADIFMSAD
jgi:hypothetical protein